MPRKPSPKNLSNPLRILRSLCSEYGETLPLTQIEFAKITGIAPDYVRSLENSRRVLNQAQRDKIRFSIGARWDLRGKRWVVNGIPDEPFNYQWYCRYRTLWFEHPHQADIETHILCRRLQALLLGAERTDYNLVFDRLWHALEQIRSELKIGAARSVFEKTTFDVDYGRDVKTGEVKNIVRQFNKIDPEILQPGGETLHQWLDLMPFSAERTWTYWNEESYTQEPSEEKPRG
jgi:hypothetical protein